MARTEPVQFNIRSKFARDRATQIAQATGMTTTQVVEEALRGYAPQQELDPPPGLKRVGDLLVLTGGPKMTLEEWNAAIEEGRSRPLFYDED